ncbi:MAG: response regulator [Deltaproteobacteria bacterium]|nr:response regulator [Deltaproteobacteria bacterium]
MAEEKKIFIAEDNPQFCELYRMALESEGYKVVFANTGKEAVDRIPSEKPDLIILDVMMPEMDGYEVCRSLRDLPHFALTPIIMLTAKTADEDKIKGYNVGADDYITKPFSLKVLRARVRNILERSTAKKVESVPLAAAPVQPAAPPAQPAAPTGIAPPIRQPPAPPAEPASPAAQPTVQVVQPIILREEEVIATPKAATPVRAIGPGEDLLEGLLGGSVPAGSNILIVGPLGSGKSFLSRSVLARALHNGEKCMRVCLDDDPSVVRKELSLKYRADVANYEGQNQIRFIDAYSWSGGRSSPQEKYAISGTLELSDLSVLISEAAAELGQTDKEKLGGKRVVDSRSSLFLNFDLSYIQRFVAYLARSGHFGDVTTIFIIEEGSCDYQALNNTKYIMDGVLELRSEGEKFLGRVQAMKWANPNREWVDMTRA